jgi:hypothetical protein
MFNVYFFQNKEPFVDDSFLPSPSSLYIDPKVPAFNHPIFWRRPNQLSQSWDRTNQPWVVYRTPMPEDIAQGILGNCWYVYYDDFVVVVVVVVVVCVCVFLLVMQNSFYSQAMLVI